LADTDDLDDLVDAFGTFLGHGNPPDLFFARTFKAF
jgi:hypothetical protein